MLPLFAVILVLSGAGFPFFTQRREGLEGRKFTVLKFRTINSKGTSNAIQRWMRKLGIDELPQLFNVLAGQMSLIGPRPHTEGDGFNYAAKIKQYKIRHWAKPGLTGLAQTRGLRGGDAAADKGLLEARIRADIYYIENWSVLLDIRLLLETVIRTVFLLLVVTQKIVVNKQIWIMKYPTLLERFTEYVQIDTQSDANSPTVPSTEKQKDLGELLVDQLKALGVQDAHMDGKGYVYATVPASSGHEHRPAVCFLCTHGYLQNIVVQVYVHCFIATTTVVKFTYQRVGSF